MLCALSLLLPSASAFVATPMRAPRTAMLSTTAQAPQMLLPEAPMVDASALDATFNLLARKSEADEFLDEIAINFPTLVGGAVFGFFVIEYLTKSETFSGIGETLEEIDLPVPLAAVFVPAAAAAIVVLGKTGILGSAGGIFMKVTFDGWNVFANVVLPGALLKY